MALNDGKGNGTALKLAVYEGGKGSGSWLWDLPDGTVFLAREKHAKNGWMLLYIQLSGRIKSACVLSPLPFGGNRLYVDPIKFSKDHELFEIVALGTEDEPSDTIQSGDMENHVHD